MMTRMLSGNRWTCKERISNEAAIASDTYCQSFNETSPREPWHNRRYHLRRRRKRRALRIARRTKMKYELTAHEENEEDEDLLKKNVYKQEERCRRSKRRR